MDVNWNVYRDVFPKRYIEPSHFDSVLYDFLKANFKSFSSKGGWIKTALDIGGGKGTGALEKFACQDYGLGVWLLDPNVEKRWWMRGSVGWDTDIKFDLVVARGSINYLNKTQIRKIPSMGCVFFANTFIEHPGTEWVTREYETINGNKGLEQFRYHQLWKMIEHKLISRYGYTIEHRFHYYEIEEYQEMLPGVQFEHYNKNSLILRLDAKSR